MYCQHHHRAKMVVICVSVCVFCNDPISHIFDSNKHILLFLSSSLSCFVLFCFVLFFFDVLFLSCSFFLAFFLSFSPHHHYHSRHALPNFEHDVAPILRRYLESKKANDNLNNRPIPQHYSMVDYNTYKQRVLGEK